MVDQHHSKIAIIDIGSNSVRLVVYDGITRTPVELFNEKVLCALGEGVALNGCLNPDGVAKALAALRRFAMLMEIMQVEHREIIGTAALRDAVDGDQFIRQVEAECGFTIRLISGDEEAELSALGAAASLPAAEGVACDLGGGSMELAQLRANGKLGERTSTLLGVLRLIDESRQDRTLAKQLIKDRLQQLKPFRKAAHGKQLVLIGGSFRSLARLYMHDTHYPLKLLHAYEADAEEMRRFCGNISKLPEDLLADVPEITGKRRYTLPMAALILQQLIKQFEPEGLIFSSCGLREGVLYDRLPQEEKRQDPLLAAVDALVERHNGNSDFGHVLAEWLHGIAPLEADRNPRLFEAACRLMTLSLSDVAVFRAEEGFMRILHAPLMGITHRERGLLALCLFHRFRFQQDYPLPSMEPLGLTAEEQSYGLLLGTLSGLAYAISGGSGRVLTTTRPTLRKDRLVIASDEPQLLATDAVQKRLYRANMALQQLQAEQKRRQGSVLKLVRKS